MASQVSIRMTTVISQAMCVGDQWTKQIISLLRQPVLSQSQSHLQVQPYTRGEERPVKHKTTLNKDPASPKF